RAADRPQRLEIADEMALVHARHAGQREHEQARDNGSQTPWLHGWTPPGASRLTLARTLKSALRTERDLNKQAAARRSGERRNGEAMIALARRLAGSPERRSDDRSTSGGPARGPGRRARPRARRGRRAGDPGRVRRLRVPLLRRRPTDRAGAARAPPRRAA